MQQSPHISPARSHSGMVISAPRPTLDLGRFAENLFFPYAGTYSLSDLKTNPGFLGCVRGKSASLWGEIIFRVFRVTIDEGLK